MSRIGFWGINELSEEIMKELFRSAPDLQVFLSPGQSKRSQKLAIEYLCWTLDDYQSVTEEAEIIIISTSADELTDMANKLKPRSTQTLISLVPDISTQHLCDLFQHADCARIKIFHGDENSKPLLILTATSHKIQHYFSLTGYVCVITNEAQFNFLNKI